MLRLLTFCIALLPFFLKGQHHYCNKIVAQHQHFKDFQDLRRSNTNTNNYDIIYHRLVLHATVKRLYLIGKATSYFKFNTSSNTIAFNLRNHLKVDSVKMGIIPLTFSQEAEFLKINLYRTFNDGELDSLTIYYQGNPSLGKYRSYFIESHASGKTLATQSEPYGTPDWWPCKQDLTDKFDSCDFIITTDTGYLAGGPGLLVSTTFKDSLVTYHWKHRYASNFYLLALGISKYLEITDTAFLNGKALPIINYVYPHLEDYARPLVKNTIPLLRVFDSLFGTYPYINEKYGHMQWNRGGGMEHATMSSMGNFNFDLVSHELAHQWFGNLVTCSNWQDIWINESFATFLNAISYELIYGKDTFYQHLEGVLNNAKKETELSIFVEDTTEVGRIFNQLTSYQKGAMVLQTLRVHIGDSAFYAACRNFLNDYKWGSANNNNLIAAFQKVTDKDINQFMQSFYYGKGYPTYLVRWNQVNDKLKIELNQSNSNLNSVFFPQTLVLNINNENGTEETLLIDVNQPRFNIEISYESKIKQIIFNKNNQILATGTVVKQEENGVSQVSLYPNPGNGNISIVSNKYPITSVIIYDNTGKLLMTFNNIMDFKININLSSLEMGNFIVEVNTIEEKYIKRYEKNK